MIELLSPVGDFECLQAAVQNGADAVYFGANLFSARAFASNFDDNALEQAIHYAKIRGVKTHLTLNTLIKNHELADAINLAKKAYHLGIDAIIVQDLGLAKFLIDHFPGLQVHGSTQMSVHNLEGVLQLQKLGFSRVVLSRELHIKEIETICKNANIEIETFIHGALCISYSGQCLFSSMIGGRSGNRGKCAQPCRLPYELLEDDICIDKGYLLSPRDLCGLEFLPQLIKAGVSSLKIEGRMKTPEYVATVTRIYRKYIDLVNQNQDFVIDEKDKKDLLQVFNRGGFSNGHLNTDSNQNLIYKDKPDNMGIYLGTISHFNANQGHITFVTNDTLRVGDKIRIENKKHESSPYTISELMSGKNNIKEAHTGDKITVGRMKGNIYSGNKIFKISDKALSSFVQNQIYLENRKVDLHCKITIKKDIPISVELWDSHHIKCNITSDIVPIEAINAPITKDRIIRKFSKTNNTPYRFTNIEIDLDDNLYIPSISSLNELRRQLLHQYETMLIQSFKRNMDALPNPIYSDNKISESSAIKSKSISLLLNILNTNFDYTTLQDIDRLYIPFKYFCLKDFAYILEKLCKNFNTYIYMPVIMRNHYTNMVKTKLDTILNHYNIKGFVISNIGTFELLNTYKNHYEYICNYTFNIYNDLTIKELHTNMVTLSPELNKQDLQDFASTSQKEVIVYGNIPLMNSNYCLLGKANKCYPSCNKKCLSSKKYYLKDRLGFQFRILPDNIETVTTIYNSKITSISPMDLHVDSLRIDILDENIAEIQNIIYTVKSGNKFEGHAFTNGNFNKEV